MITPSARRLLDAARIYLDKNTCTAWEKVLQQNELREAIAALEQETPGEKNDYHKVMGLLRSMDLNNNKKHGQCEPREQRACTACNAKDDLEALMARYRGEPISIATAKETPVSKGEYEVVIPCIDARDACACIDNLKESNPASSGGAYMRASNPRMVIDPDGSIHQLSERKVTLPQRNIYAGDGHQNDTFDVDDVLAMLRDAGVGIKP